MSNPDCRCITKARPRDLIIQQSEVNLLEAGDVPLDGIEHVGNVPRAHSLIGLLAKTLRSIVPSSTKAASHRSRSSVAFTTLSNLVFGTDSWPIFAAQTTLLHLSVNSTMCLPNSELANPVSPNSAIRSLILELTKPALIAWLRFSKMSAGVFLGASAVEFGDLAQADGARAVYVAAADIV